MTRRRDSEQNEEKLLRLDNLAQERRRIARDRALRRSFADTLLPGLPVDADACAMRIPDTKVGSVLDAIVDSLVAVREPFFDVVCENWTRLFPDVPARPGRMREGRLFLYVRTSGILFTLRPKLAAMKRKILALPGAPAARRLSLHLEVRGQGAVIAPDPCE